MTQSMKEYIGIREATQEEIDAYNKVEALDDDAWQRVSDLMYAEEIEDLIHNTIKNAELVQILTQYGITVAEACAWYFTEVE